MGKTLPSSFELFSPDENIHVLIEITDGIQYSISFKNKPLLEPSSLSMTLEGQGVLGSNPHLAEVERETVDTVIQPVVREKQAKVPEQYQELRLVFEGGYEVIFRAYNDGVAYRFVTNLQEQRIQVASEQVEFNFSGDCNIYFPEEEGFMSQHEKGYPYLKLKEIADSRFANTPALVDQTDGPKVLVTEADLEDYPGLYLQGTGAPALTGIFPQVPAKEELKTDRDLVVTEREAYIAETSGKRTFPWRVLAIAPNDAALLENQLIYKLGRPLQLEDTSWIKPGKAAWDGWNSTNIYDVDFRPDSNMSTYKYYVDFASRLGLEYFVVDEGWYEKGDLSNNKVDIGELVEYGKQKGVGIILWVVWKTLEDQWEQAFNRFERWGIKGIKTDFMQRDDQSMVNWNWKVAREAARRQLLVEFHGSYKPTGLRRAYPNVLSWEAVKGLEQVKGLNHNHPNFGRDVTPEHDVTIPFIRMPTGPMDYTPGAMVNAQPKNFRVIFQRPMSMGTRCHQLAMYVIYESPLQMLADSPTHYLKQKKELLRYLSEVPTTWDETRVLKATIGDYLVLARRKGKRWYVGAMTDEQPRSFNIDLSFLDQGSYTLQLYRDGANADQYAEDYRYDEQEITSESELVIELATGGGWVGVFHFNKM